MTIILTLAAIAGVTVLYAALAIFVWYWEAPGEDERHEAGEAMNRERR